MLRDIVNIILSFDEDTYNKPYYESLPGFYNLDFDTQIEITYHVHFFMIDDMPLRKLELNEIV